MTYNLLSSVLVSFIKDFHPEGEALAVVAVEATEEAVVAEGVVEEDEEVLVVEIGAEEVLVVEEEEEVAVEEDEVCHAHRSQFE